MKGEIQVLIAFIKRQETTMEGIFREIEQRIALLDTSPEVLIFVAYYLHNLYCSLEDIFKEVSRVFENTIDEPEKWHRELLLKMTLEVEGIRPRLISEESFVILDELRGFRHFFRHAYSVPMDGERVKQLVDKTMKLRESIKDDTKNFINQLKAEIERNSSE